MVIRVWRGVVIATACSGFLYCISTPFDMNGVVSGAFSGSFRRGAVFSLSDV